MSNLLNISLERGFIMVKFYLFEEEEMKGRWKKCQVEMEKEGIDVLILSKPSNLFYMTGYRSQIFSSDFRAMIAVMPRGGEPTLVLPNLEGPSGEKESWFPHVRRWGNAQMQGNGRYATLISKGLRPGVGGQIEAKDSTELILKIFKENNLLKATVGMELDGFQRIGMPQNDFEAIKASLPNCKFKGCANIMWKLRRVKSKREIEFMKKAGQITDAGYNAVAEVIKTGMSEREIRGVMGQAFLREGGEENAFIIVASGPDRYDMCNPWASDRKIKKGEEVLLDFGAVYNGYYSDIQRLFFMAPIHDKQRELQEKAILIYQASVKKAKPGNAVEEVDIAAFEETKRLGLEHLMFHRTGHSVGLEIQELPSIAVPEKTILEPGMCFAVEPGLYDYAYGAFKIENNIVITKDGYENLTNCSTEITVR
jgi:Xaa-Pro aminopeptidase